MQKKYALMALIGLPLAAIALWAATRFFFVASVTVTQPVQGTAIEAVYATGTVEATVMLPIAARTTARLTALHTDEGSEVEEGQVLAQLEDSDLQQSIVQLQAKADYARSTYERNKALAAKHFISKEELDRAEADMRAAVAALNQAKAEAGYLKLLAPADGHIIRRDGEIGELIPANQPVFWLSCCAPLRISAEVDEEDIAKVKPGQEVVIRADAFPNAIFHGKVESITPKGDPIARSYRVRVTFVGKVPLLIGMTAETNIIINKHDNALLVPAGSVENHHVWRVEQDTLKQQAVTTGIEGLEQVEILSGLAPNDTIVLNPSDKFKEGQRVHIKLSEAAR